MLDGKLEIFVRDLKDSLILDIETSSAGLQTFTET